MYQVHQLQLVSPSVSCFIFFSVHLEGLCIDLSFCFQFYSAVTRNGKVHSSACSLFSFFFSFLLIISRSGHLVIWPRLGDPFVSQNRRKFCVSHFLQGILVCTYTICIWSLNKTKYPQVSRTLLSMVAYLSNTLVWMVSACRPIFNSSSPHFEAFCVRSNRTNYDQYHRYFHIQ